MLMTLRFILCFVKIYFMFFEPYPFSEKKGFSLLYHEGRGTILQSLVAITLCFFMFCGVSDTYISQIRTYISYQIINSNVFRP